MPSGWGRALWAAWARRRLSLSGLTAAQRLLIAAGGAVSLAATVLLVIDQLTDRLALSPFGSPETLFREDPRPVLVVVLLLCLTVAALAAATAIRGLRPVGAGIGLVLLAAVIVSFASRIYVLAGDVGRIYQPSGAEGAGALGTVRAGAAVAIVVPVGGLIAALVPSRIVRATAAPLIAGSYLVVLVTWVAMATSGASVRGREDVRFPESFPVARVISMSLQLHVLMLAGAAMLLTLWQAVVGARAARDVAGIAGRLAGRAAMLPRRKLPRRQDAEGFTGAAAWVVGAVLVGKLLWVGAGLAGMLPASAGGTNEVWLEQKADGWLSWLLAAVSAVLIGWWLKRGCPGPVSDGPLVVAAVGVVTALTIPEIIYQVVAAAGVYTDADALAVAEWVEKAQPWSLVVVAGAAAGLALGLARRRRAGSAVLFLALFAGWLGLRLPLLVKDLVQYGWYPWTYAMPSEMDGQRPGWINLATLDTMLTAVLVVAAGYAAVRRSRQLLSAVVVVGFASSVVAYASVLGGDIVLTAIGANMAFLLPLAYQLLFDAEELNAEGPRRSQRLLTVSAVAVLGLAVAVLRSTRGGPAADMDLAMAGTVLTPPTLAAAVAVLLSRRARAAERLRPTPAPPDLTPSRPLESVAARP